MASVMGRGTAWRGDGWSASPVFCGLYMYTVYILAWLTATSGQTRGTIEKHSANGKSQEMCGLQPHCTASESA
ncbi:hypothetical protein CBM2634_B160355 [Cupriavidus taiwanensis]|uniref:Uncharacterized protein n=1 Tax=Cupriavidus taiwanensis TaxID=164546 RepID=A0A375J6I8_9BURK|nr:hypothetical protein CBM2634_B160355 [Cupriavidus taiwanensis]